MLFCDLRTALLNSLRHRVHNGELTERGLARLTGVSQPHMHNLLKGVRSLSLEMSDRLLKELRISALDLIEPAVLARHLQTERPDPASYSFLPVLDGRIGPAHPWPGGVELHERFPVSVLSVNTMWHPVVVRLADDARMHPLFSAGDWMLLDQSHRARTSVDSRALYVVKQGNAGLVRRLRMRGEALYMATEDTIESPGQWERLAGDTQQITHWVRARGTFIAPERDWSGSAETSERTA